MKVCTIAVLQWLRNERNVNGSSRSTQIFDETRYYILEQQQLCHNSPSRKPPTFPKGKIPIGVIIKYTTTQNRKTQTSTIVTYKPMMQGEIYLLIYSWKSCHLHRASHLFSHHTSVSNIRRSNASLSSTHKYNNKFTTKLLNKLVKPYKHLQSPTQGHIKKMAYL